MSTSGRASRRLVALITGGGRGIGRAIAEAFARDAVEFLARSNPGGRLVRPEEVAAVAVKLLDDDTTNGEAIVIDGSAWPPPAA